MAPSLQAGEAEEPVEEDDTTELTVDIGYPPPLGVYREFQADQLFDFQQPDRKLIYLNPNDASRLHRLSITNRLNILPPGDASFICTQCIGQADVDRTQIQWFPTQLDETSGHWYLYT